jgi:hypothetical protein
LHSLLPLPEAGDALVASRSRDGRLSEKEHWLLDGTSRYAMPATGLRMGGNSVQAKLVLSRILMLWCGVSELLQAKKFHPLL